MLDRTIQPRICEPEQLAVPSPECRVMKNGIPLYILNAGDNEVVRIDLLIEGGRWQQSQRLQALFTNRMLREGTRRYSAAAIAEKLDYYGAWLELSSSSEYAYITLYSLNKYLPETLDVFESIVKEPLFPEKELGVIIDSNIQQFLVNSSKVDFLAHRTLINAVYGDTHPCGQLVQKEDYYLINPSVLQSFYDRYYHSGAVRMGMLSLDRRHPDYLKVRVLVTLFGGYFGSRLMSNIREDKGYTYGISAGIMPYPDSGLLVVNAETANEFVEPLIKEVYHEIDRLQNDLVPVEELAMVRNYMLGDMCRSYESAFSLADAWIFIHTSGLPDSYVRDAVEAVKTITPAEIRELASRYLCKETLKEIVSGKKMS